MATATIRIPVDQGVTIYTRFGNWWIDIVQDHARTRKPLKTSDRTKALAIAREFAASLVSSTWNVKLAGETTLARAVPMFAEEYESLHHSVNTRKFTKCVYAKFQRFLTRRYPKIDVKLDSIRRGDIEAYQRERITEMTVRKTKVSPATVNRDVREISTLFSWAVRKGAARMNPCVGVRTLKEIRRVKKPLSTDEITKLIAKLPATLADLARLILNTGLRLGEALHLRGEDIDTGTKLLVVRSRPDYLVKDREEREIPLNEVALAILTRRKLAAGDGGLAFPTGSGRLLGNRNILRDLKTACGHAGIRPIDWYLLRHTFATNLAKYVHPHVLKTLMGHADVRTADKFYVHLRGGDMTPPPVAAG